MNKAKLVRKPSPPRAETENTFLKKLAELRQIRQQNHPNGDHVKKKLIVNGKEALEHQGDWALFESSKGRKYYFNIKTQTNQWVKPEEWIEKVVPQPPGKIFRETKYCLLFSSLESSGFFCQILREINFGECRNTNTAFFPF